MGSSVPPPPSPVWRGSGSCPPGWQAALGGTAGLPHPSPSRRGAQSVLSQFSLTLLASLKPLCILALSKPPHFSTHGDILCWSNSWNGTPGLHVQFQLLFCINCRKEGYPHPGKVPKSLTSKIETPRVGWEGRELPWMCLFSPSYF